VKAKSKLFFVEHDAGVYDQIFQGLDFYYTTTYDGEG
jgi:hypothetical protein